MSNLVRALNNEFSYVLTEDPKAGFYQAVELPYYRDRYLVVDTDMEKYGYARAKWLPMERVQNRWLVTASNLHGYQESVQLPYTRMGDALVVNVWNKDDGFWPAMPIPIFHTPQGTLVVDTREGYAEAEALPEYHHLQWVYEYYTNPMVVCEKDQPGDELVYGLELETRPIGDAARLHINKGGFIWKMDSSCGYELVSVPMPLGVMCTVLEAMPLGVMRVDASCGMHVHINRRALTQRQQCLLALLISDEEYSDEIDAVAGRIANAMCKKTKAKSHLELVSSADRYEAVNLTNYSEQKYTVEIRIFAGTNSAEEVIKRLRWVDSLVQFLKSDMASSSYKDYKKWRAINALNNYWKFKYIS